jgi:hypothetical protein
MKQILIIMAVAAMSGAMIGAASINNLAAGADGKAIFTDSKCQNCHSIDALGIKRTAEPKAGELIPADLSGEGLKHNADWFTGWLNKEVELDGHKHLKKFKGSAGDLTTLSNWLATMKTKGKK